MAETPTQDARPFAWASRLAPRLVFPVVAFVVWRLAIHFLAWLSWTLDDRLRNGQWIERTPELRAAGPAFDALYRWDAGWYWAIARSPYTDPHHANFFPAFPLEARALGTLFTLDLQLALLLAATINALIACVALYLLVERIAGRDAARWSLVAWLAYPFSFFQATAYPESLTVAAGAAALALEVSGHRVWSLIGAGLSAFTRHTSAYGALAQALYRFSRGKWWSRPLPLVAWGLGLSVFCAFLWKTYGDPLMFLTVRNLYWADGFKPIWELTIAGSPMMIPGAVFCVALTVIGLIGLASHPSTRFLLLPTVLWLGVLLINGATGLGRHSSSVWPAFVGIGVLCANRPTWAAVFLALTAPFGGLMLFLHAHQWHVF
ncbi:MAG: hypothetical protein U0228_18850 [Myxococcaceae bacterium]